MYIDDQHKFLNVYNLMYAGFSYNIISEGCLKRTIKVCMQKSGGL